MKTALIGALILATAACGGGAKPETTPPVDDQQHEATARGGMAKEGEHGQMAAPVAKFHDTLAPRWHAEHGPKRMADTCAALPQFHGDAAAIIASPAPEGADPTAWSTGGAQLDGAVTALEAPCKANDAAAFEPAFERLHTSFHQLMEASGGHHEKH